MTPIALLHKPETAATIECKMDNSLIVSFLLTSALSRLPHDPFVVPLPFTHFASCSSPVIPLKLNIILSPTSSSCAGFTVLPLFKWKVYQYITQAFVFPFSLQCSCARYCLFYQQLKLLPPLFAVCIAPSLAVCFFARGPTRQVKQRQMKLLVCQRRWRELITIQ